MNYLEVLGFSVGIFVVGFLIGFTICGGPIALFDLLHDWWDGRRAARRRNSR